MNPGDLVVIFNSNKSLDGAAGLDLETYFAHWVSNGTIGMYCDEPGVSHRKFRVLIDGEVRLFDPTDARPFR